MKNIIRYEIHYGGSLRSGRLNIAKASMIRNQPCNENELITNEQSIVLSLSKLLEVIIKIEVILGIMIIILLLIIFFMMHKV